MRRPPAKGWGEAALMMRRAHKPLAGKGRQRAEPGGLGPRKPYWDSARRVSSIGHIRSSSARARISLSG
jgi:hypothetical protein